MAPPKEKGPAPSFAVGDLVLGKVKGYPPWPARIVEPSNAPKAVLKERPQKNSQGYFCVKFFPAGDYAWQVARDLAKLDKHVMEAYVNEPSKRNGELLEAYKTALNPEDWEKEQERIAQQALAAEKDAPVDELEDDEDEAETGQKRKRDAGEKKGKSGKGASSKDKKSKDSSDPKSKKQRKKGPISSANIESEDDGEGKKGDGERPSKRAKGDDDDDDEVLSEEAKMVKGWRHELQRIFLSKNHEIKPEDIPKANETLNTVEQYDSKITVELLSSSKIGKVLKKIIALPNGAIPDDEKYGIRERGKKLVTAWSKFVATNEDAPTSSPAVNGVEPTKDADVNGTHKMDVDAAPAPAAQESSAPAPTTDTEMKEAPAAAS